MTPGELIVCAVRAQTLSDALNAHVRVVRRVPHPPHIATTAALSVWHAQRLASACDRALGTRGRHYDNAAGQGGTTERR